MECQSKSAFPSSNIYGFVQHLSDEVKKNATAVITSPTFPSYFDPDYYVTRISYCSFLATARKRQFSLRFAKEREPSEHDLITNLWIVEANCFIKAFYDGGANVCAIGPMGAERFNDYKHKIRTSWVDTPNGYVSFNEVIRLNVILGNKIDTKIPLEFIIIPNFEPRKQKYDVLLSRDAIKRFGYEQILINLDEYHTVMILT